MYELLIIKMYTKIQLNKKAVRRVYRLPPAVHITVVNPGKGHRRELFFPGFLAYAAQSHITVGAQKPVSVRRGAVCGVESVQAGPRDEIVRPCVVAIGGRDAVVDIRRQPSECPVRLRRCGLRDWRGNHGGRMASGGRRR